jgi:hypothetical protein
MGVKPFVGSVKTGALNFCEPMELGFLAILNG